jgi:hypothetical protein
LVVRIDDRSELGGEHLSAAASQAEGCPRRFPVCGIGEQANPFRAGV